MRKARKVLLLGLALALAGGAAFAQQVDFSKYVALGDSLTAVYASAGLAKFYQDHSYPAVLAQQFGVANFQQPIVSDPGIPPVLELKALTVVGGSVVPVLQPKSGQGQPLNATLATPYNNLGIPGAKTNDLLTKTGDITKLLTGNIDPNTLMYDLILRNKTNTALEQAIGLQGTFYSVWIGSNEVLGAALSGVALDGVTLTPAAAFQTQYTTLLGAIRQQRPSAKIVVATVPEVVAIPFVTTVKPYIFTPQGQKVYLLGEAGPLTDNDYVTLGGSALIQQGFGIPGTGKLLPEGSVDAAGLHAGVILRAGEIAAIRARTAEVNGIIKAVAGGVGAAVVDANAIFNDILAHGYMVGGIRLTSAFLTGGILSYDGVHPQRLGNAIVANEFIKVINAGFGAHVPQVNLLPLLTGESAAVATTVMAANTVFSEQAAISVIKLFAPNALTDKLQTGSHVVRRHIADHPAREPVEPTVP